jgi:hypothetical protein
MTDTPRYGYASVESLVFEFVKASYLIPKDHSAYTDIRQLVEGKRRFFLPLSGHRAKKNLMQKTCLPLRHC